MKKIGIIGVPSSAGARQTGQEQAPRAFRQASLVEHLRSAGLSVTDFGDLPEVPFRPDEQNPKGQNLQLVVEVAERVANQVEAVRATIVAALRTTTVARVPVAWSLLRLDRSAEERGVGRRRAEDVDPVGMTAEFAGEVAVGVDVV